MHKRSQATRSSFLGSQTMEFTLGTADATIDVNCGKGQTLEGVPGYEGNTFRCVDGAKGSADPAQGCKKGLGESPASGAYVHFKNDEISFICKNGKAATVGRAPGVPAGSSLFTLSC